MADLLADATTLWQQGGFVMPWLVGSTVVLWWAIGERAWGLRRGTRRSLRDEIDAHLAGRGQANGVLGTAVARVAALPASLRTPHRVREALADLYDQLGRHAVLVASLAAMAPLVGLLGTVTGMIETFDSLTTMSLHRSSGGVAGGISEALVSTQMGLAVAIPGLLAGRTLERAQLRLEEELDALPEMFATRGRPPVHQEAA
jgi:biopolymer transport protein ExbB